MTYTHNLTQHNMSYTHLFRACTCRFDFSKPADAQMWHKVAYANPALVASSVEASIASGASLRYHCQPTRLLFHVRMPPKCTTRGRGRVW